jgi:ABC-type multidrug transport system fused ATPase/permease subunit
MWRRWLDNLYIELYWRKRVLVRRWHLDTPTRMSGILVLTTGVLLLFILGNGAAHVFRAFVPWVSGSRIGDVYWQSISFGIKITLMFLLFCASVIALIIFKFTERR